MNAIGIQLFIDDKKLQLVINHTAHDLAWNGSEPKAERLINDIISRVRREFGPSETSVNALVYRTIEPIPGNR